ncbi:hypothetical protein ACHAXR_001404, partial [Thalassiosira sp. AJA248-18]
AMVPKSIKVVAVTAVTISLSIQFTLHAISSSSSPPWDNQHRSLRLAPNNPEPITSSSASSAAAAVDALAIAELYKNVTHSRLQSIATEHSAAYATAAPFPHIAFDGLFPRRFVEAISREIPENTQCGATEFRHKDQLYKSFEEDEDLMGLHTRTMFSFMKSRTFIQFLEALTGISNLIPDPKNYGSGIHCTKAEGHLDVHADFNRLKPYGLDRRVNVFVYLNDDWPEEYGGHLELWARDMRSCHERILPTFGRFVVFSSTDFSYHGHPVPLAAPEGRMRRSLALYFYTNGRPQEECLGGNCNRRAHDTLFQYPKGCKLCEEDSCKRYDDNVPSWVLAK